MPNKPTHTENISNNNNKPVHPKDASSLIILRNSRKSIEVLMGRRPLSSRFMPGIYVFPGGALDKTDYYVFKNDYIFEYKNAFRYNKDFGNYRITLCFVVMLGIQYMPKII